MGDQEISISSLHLPLYFKTSLRNSSRVPVYFMDCFSKIKGNSTNTNASSIHF